MVDCFVQRTSKGEATQMTNPAQSARRNRDEEILDAAIQVFSQKGYAAASLQDVADAVGLLKGSLYHYITSKESLLYRIFQESHEEAATLMAAVDDLDLSPDAKLREFVRQLTLFYEHNRERASLYFGEWRHLTGEDLQTVMKQRQDFELYVRRIIIDAHERGITAPDLDVKLATRFILTAVNGVILWYRPEGPLPAEDIAEQIAELACSSVLRRKRPTNRGMNSAA
jgi:TetR/AcrR family transcriptional regulator, cholesterol catabolism regulator